MYNFIKFICLDCGHVYLIIYDNKLSSKSKALLEAVTDQKKHLDYHHGQPYKVFSIAVSQHGGGK